MINMKFSAIGFLVVLLAIRCSTLAVEKDETGQSGAETPRKGHVEIDEDVWYRYHDEPPLHMERAREGFLKHELETSSREIRKAGGYLHAAASHAEADLKSVLQESATELDDLGEEVRQGTVDSIGRLENAFARAEHALAMHNQRMAQRAMERADAIRSGQYLRTAIKNAEDSARWAGHKLEAGSKNVLGHGRELAVRMMETPGFLVQESGKGILSVGAELQQFGKWLEPRRITVKPNKKTN